MSILKRMDFDSYPDSPYGIAEREWREYSLLQTEASVLSRGHVMGGMSLTAEQDAIIKKAQETSPPTHFGSVQMWPGRRHNRMYGIWRHQFVGTGAFALLRQECVCGKVRVF